MTSDDKDTSVLELDNSIIESAQAAIDKLPKTVAEQIERWAYLGKAAEEQLTEEEQLLLMSRDWTVKFEVKSKDGKK
jgi:hypothetical protein